IDRVFVDPAGKVVLDDLAGRLQGVPTDMEVGWPEMIHGSKRNIADGILRSQVPRLARLVPGPDGADDAIAELLAAFPVYRSYLPYGIENLQHAARFAAARRPELAARIDALVPVLSDPEHLAAIRFQQTSGMVMAKGVEDTAFYR